MLATPLPPLVDGLTGIDDRAASAVCGASPDDAAFNGAHSGAGKGDDDVFTPWPSPPPPTNAAMASAAAQPQKHIFGRLKAEFTRVVAGGLTREKSNTSLSGGGGAVEEGAEADAHAPAASVLIDKLKQIGSRVVGRTASTDETEAAVGGAKE